MDEKIKFYNCHHGLAQCEHIEDGRTVYSVVLFEDLNNWIYLGIDDKGRWIIKDKQAIFILDDPKSFLYCEKLLEYSFHFVVQEIVSRFETIDDRNMIFAVSDEQY